MEKGSSNETLDCFQEKLERLQMIFGEMDVDQQREALQHFFCFGQKLFSAVRNTTNDEKVLAEILDDEMRKQSCLTKVCTATSDGSCPPLEQILLQERIKLLQEENRELKEKVASLTANLGCVSQNESQLIVGDILENVIDGAILTSNERKISTRRPSRSSRISEKDVTITKVVAPKRRGRPPRSCTQLSRTSIQTKSPKRKKYSTRKVKRDAAESTPEAKHQPETTHSAIKLKLAVGKTKSSTAELIKIESVPTVGSDATPIEPEEYADDQNDSCDDLVPLLHEDKKNKTGKKRRKMKLRNDVSVKRAKLLEEEADVKVSKIRTTFVCSRCDEEFVGKRLFRRHLATHDEGPCSCRLCRKTLENSAFLQLHKCAKKRSSKCSLCDKTFYKAANLTTHMKNVHSLDNSLHCCKHCSETFTQRLPLFLHYGEHAKQNEEVVCLRCGVFCSPGEEFKSHLRTHDPKANYACEHCEEMFASEQEYLGHMAEHPSFACFLCGSAYFSKASMQEHLTRDHAKEHNKPHACEVCGKRYTTAEKCENHFKKEHGDTGDSISCDVCCLNLRSRRALALHRKSSSHRTRVGELPAEKKHLCATCGRRYYRKHALLRHMRYHTGEKPYKCPHCDYICREDNNLKMHIALHFTKRDFVCETCGSAFHQKKTLERHILYKHSDVRNYACSDCMMAFKTAYALGRHQQVHNNSRPHSCVLCSATFKRQYNLRHHMKVVHQNKDMLPEPRHVKVLDAPSPTSQENAEVHEAAGSSDVAVPDEVAQAVPMEVIPPPLAEPPVYPMTVVDTMVQGPLTLTTIDPQGQQQYQHTVTYQNFFPHQTINPADL